MQHVKMSLLVVVVLIWITMVFCWCDYVNTISGNHQKNKNKNKKTLFLVFYLRELTITSLKVFNPYMWDPLHFIFSLNLVWSLSAWVLLKTKKVTKATPPAPYDFFSSLNSNEEKEWPYSFKAASESESYKNKNSSLIYFLYLFKPLTSL